MTMKKSCHTSVLLLLLLRTNEILFQFSASFKWPDRTFFFFLAPLCEGLFKDRRVLWIVALLLRGKTASIRALLISTPSSDAPFFISRQDELLCRAPFTQSLFSHFRKSLSLTFSGKPAALFSRLLLPGNLNRICFIKPFLCVFRNAESSLWELLKRCF